MESDSTKVIVIDDEKTVRDGCEKILRDAGYKVEVAEDGETGLEKIESGGYDIAIIDLKMPRLSGIELIEAIREKNIEIVPIVITGYASISSTVEAMKVGAYDYLSKPFTPDELMFIMRRAEETVRLRKVGKRLLTEHERDKKNFFLTASHQMRSPLVAIQSVIRVIMSGAVGGDEESLKKLLQQAYDRSEDMLDMVNDILNLAEATVGKEESAEQTDAAAELNAVVSVLRHVAAERNMTIDVDVQQNLPAVRIARKSMNHIFTNLVENAVKYSKDGTTVRASLAAEGDTLRFEVVDQGIGIPEEDQGRIFKEFFRAGNAKSLKNQGTGLGLAIVRSIVRNLGGEIGFKSKENEGTTFTVKIPFVLKLSSEE